MIPLPLSAEKSFWPCLFESVRDLLPGPGRTAVDNHRFLNGVMWVLRSGAHWHDLPECYGNWRSAHKRFSRWAKNGFWEAVFTRLLKTPRMIT